MTATTTCVCTEGEKRAGMVNPDCPLHGYGGPSSNGSGEPVRWLTGPELTAAVAAMPAQRWLVTRLLRHDPGDYAVLSGPPKAGKTWLLLDLAVAVASGQRWLGQFPTTQARVLVFTAEASVREVEERAEAIARHYGTTLEDLPGLAIVAGAAELGSIEGVEQFRREVDAFSPALVIVEPFGRSVGGKVNLSQLNEAYAVLGRAQEVVQAAGAVLLLGHHWNRGGTGTGPSRASGAGAFEWGRVQLAIHEAEDARLTTGPDGMTTWRSSLVLETLGGRSTVGTIHLVREVVSHPVDLSVRPVYRCEMVEGTAAEKGPDVRAKVLAAVAAHPGRYTSTDLFRGADAVGARSKVERAVAQLLDAGELTTQRWKHPATGRSANRLKLGPVFDVDQHGAPTQSGEVGP